MKLQQKLDAAKISGIGVQITQQECEEFIYLRASGIKIAQLQAELDKANEANERLKKAIHRAIDVLPKYPGSAKHCLLKALNEVSP